MDKQLLDNNVWQAHPELPTMIAAHQLRMEEDKQQAGKLGSVIGYGPKLADYVAVFMILGVLIFVLGFTIFGKEEGSLTKEGLWSIASPLFLGGLGYLFGRNSSAR
jgi:hypothetical protein